MRRILSLVLPFLACALLIAEETRPATWATPLPDHVGCPNLAQVSPGLYRGAQPTAAGMAELERLGIHTVVNLRGFHSDKDELENTSLVYRRIQFHTWHAEDEDVVEFLRIVTKPENQPVFVHCQHGADRTGTMCAVYRIVVQKWTIEEAIREMTEGGFNYHEIWSNLPKYLRALDVAKLRREAGLDP